MSETQTSTGDSGASESVDVANAAETTNTNDVNSESTAEASSENESQASGSRKNLDRFLGMDQEKLAENIEGIQQTVRDGVNRLLKVRTEEFENMLPEKDLLFADKGTHVELEDHLEPDELQYVVDEVYQHASDETRRDIDQLLGTTMDAAEGIIPKPVAPAEVVPSEVVQPESADEPPESTQEKKSWYQRWEGFWKYSGESSQKIEDGITSFISPKSPQGTFNFFSKNFYVWRWFGGLFGKRSTQK